MKLKKRLENLEKKAFITIILLENTYLIKTYSMSSTKLILNLEFQNWKSEQIKKVPARYGLS